MSNVGQEIGLKEAIDMIRACKKSNTQRAVIEFISYDRKRKGSKAKVISGAFSAKGSHNEMKNSTIHVATDNKFEPTPIHTLMIVKVNNRRVYV